AATTEVVGSSFRGDAKHRTMVRNCAPENLEIPGLVLSDHPGMTISIYDSAGRTAGTRRFGSHRVRITLRHDSTPSNTMEAAASVKKFCAVAPRVDSHQPPVAMNTSRAVCASTGPITLAAPCDEK